MPVAVLSRSSGGRASREAVEKPRQEITHPALLVLHTSIPPHFQQAQQSLANHRKNIVSLHRIHQKVASIIEPASDGRVRPIGEKVFNQVLFGCLDRVLPIKKGVPNADRVCKFVAGYVIYAQEQFRLQARADKAEARKAAGEAEEDDDEDEDEEDTTATRFTMLLLKHLLKGFGSKNKNVRLRCCGCIALLINGLEAVDEDFFQKLKKFLLDRAKDKESAVRVQAVIALTKLQSTEDDDDEDSEQIRQSLIETLRFDPSAEVRRAALFNLTPNDENSSLLLERLRDIDPINRRCVYLGSLAMMLKAQSNALQGADSAQAGPSCLGLDIDAAGEVIRIGMGEREPSVKRAAQKLVTSWFDACGSDLVVFLNQFDVVASKHIEAALLTIFESRPAIVAQVSFDADEFWANLSPSTAFLARVFVDYFKRIKNDRRLEECLPMVTALAFRIEKEYVELVELIEQYNAKANSALAPEDELEIALFVIRNKTFVVSQLLGIALASDYGDEIGRRKMFGLVRDMISDVQLPEDLVPTCLDVLLKLSSGQKDFMRVIVETVQVLGAEDEDEMPGFDDGEADDTMSVEGTPLARKAPRKSIKNKDSAPPAPNALALEHRRLTIVRAMLERVVGALQENTAFHGLIPQLIAPAVRSKDGTVRELGLTCLTLCCLLDRKLALDSFPLFIDQVQRAEGTIKLRAVQAVFDLLINHTIPYLCSRNPAGEEMAKRQIISYLLSLLEDDEPAVQSAACEGMAKLMLTGMVEDDEALKSLVLIYMSPETMENQELRQCLSYFLPVYCGSSSWNQRRLQRVFISVLQVLTEVYEEKDEDQEMVTPTQVGLQLLDWTDPDKIMMGPGRTRDETVHVDVAIELIKAMYTIDEKDRRKVMCQLLGKVLLPEELEDAKVQEVLILLTGLKELNPVEDTVSKNAIGRFESSFVKTYAAQVEAGLDGLDLDSTKAFDGMKAFFDAIRIDPQDVISAYAKSSAKSSKSSRKSTPKGSCPARSSAAAGSKKSRKRHDEGEEEKEDDEEQDDDEDEDDDE
ncbi:hypothetical protein NDA18_002353 [Ustilago nuda]|nr:hypothetical protein NDA18_002353 [Ustilago nuda]